MRENHPTGSEIIIPELCGNYALSSMGIKNNNMHRTFGELKSIITDLDHLLWTKKTEFHHICCWKLSIV